MARNVRFPPLGNGRLPTRCGHQKPPVSLSKAPRDFARSLARSDRQLRIADHAWTTRAKAKAMKPTAPRPFNR